MVRLTRCLKGHALDTLRLHYGRPEIMINNILMKMRSEPLPRCEKLKSLIAFALSVQNLCCTMEVSGLMSHITNPTVMVELTDRTPAQMRLNWAIFTRSASINEPNIQDLSRWL